MNRQQRRAEAAQQAAQAAALASEAGRVLQERAQAKTQEPEEAKPQRPEGWRPPARNEPRQAAIAELEEKEKERAKAAGHTNIEEPKEEPKVEAKPEPKEEPKEEPKVEEPVQQQEAAPASTTQEAGPKTVKVKIYGEEKEVPESEVEEYGGVKGYQIAMAAKKDREELKAQLEQARKTQELMTQLLSKQAPKEETITDDQFIASKVDAIRFGTPEESAAALKEVLARTSKPLDAQSLEMRILERMKNEQAVSQFKQEFADIVSNPLMMKLAQTLERERIAEAVKNGPVDWTEFYRKIGNETRSVSGGKTTAASTSQTGQTTSPSEKEAKKSSIVNLPTAGQRASLPTEEKPPSREEVLAMARKARGQGY